MSTTTPRTRHYVARNGKRVSPLFDTENEADTWLLRHQPMSNDWALRYEGYTMENTAVRDLPVVQPEDGLGHLTPQDVTP